MQKTKIQNYDYTVEIRKASENKEIEEKQKNINEKLINSKHIVYALQKEYSSLDLIKMIIYRLKLRIKLLFK